MASAAEFEPILPSIPAARSFVSGELEPSDDEDIAVLLTSELSANAVAHAQTPFTVAVTHDERGLTVEVHDHDPHGPEVHPIDPWRPRGRGMQLVDTLATEWGVTLLHDDGKTVWFRLMPRA